VRLFPSALSSPHFLHRLHRALTVAGTAKSKKQRRRAAKKKRQLQEKLLAAGDLEALAPKIPLQKQTIDLPGAPGGTAEESVLAEAKRRELRQAMRTERKLKIKENNFLGSM